MHLTEEFKELGIGYDDIDSVIYGYDDSADGGCTEFRIIGILHDNITNRDYSGAGNDFIIHQSRFGKLHMDSRIQRAAVTVDQSETKASKTYLEQLSASNWYLELESHDELMADYEEQRNALRTSSYSLLGLLFSISVMNLLNTSLSNILSRRREVGILEAIGLTKSQENRMMEKISHEDL